MTEYNIFCWAKKYDDKDSFQQARYRVFNKEVGKDRYKEIKEKVNKIMNGFKLELKNNNWKEEWAKLDAESLSKLRQLPEFDAKIFKEITGINVKILNQEKDIITVNGIKYKKL